MTCLGLIDLYFRLFLYISPGNIIEFCQFVAGLKIPSVHSPFYTRPLPPFTPVLPPPPSSRV